MQVEKSLSKQMAQMWQADREHSQAMSSDHFVTPNLAAHTIVLQPTPFCNLNCNYCYLPTRLNTERMSIEVAKAVAQGITGFQAAVALVWHGGEPLAAGLMHFRSLVNVFEDLRESSKVSHAIQTNGTLLTPAWCDLFDRYGFRVGVSIDGPSWLNRNRGDWVGRPSFNRAMEGISLLKQAGIDFNVIAVVSGDSLKHAKELYEFFVNLGCPSVAINVVEKEGPQTFPVPDDDRVQDFWEGFFLAWRRQPVVRVREFSRALRWMSLVLAGDVPPPTRLDLIPTVAASGDVVVLSPELAGTEAPGYGNFVIGRLPDEPLAAVLERAEHCGYVRDFLKGVRLCAQTCDYYSFCGGGQASNKYFELGSLVKTETAFCRNSRIRLVEGLLTNMERYGGEDGRCV
jgi:uncharacterized protein